ncbi:MAG: type III secretion system chaperone [Pseudomonadota bacterium]
MDPFEIERWIARLGDGAIGLAEVAELVEQYGRHIGAEGLALDDDRTAWLKIDDTVELCLFHMDHFAGIAVGARLPPAARHSEQLLRRLLQANMSWQHTHGGSFAIPSWSDEPMLCRMIPLIGIDVDELDRQMAAFVATVQSWHEQVLEILETGLQTSAEGEGVSLPPVTMIKV